jgi:hypothetical protein
MALLEMGSRVLGASIWLFQRVRSRLGRGLLIANSVCSTCSPTASFICSYLEKRIRECLPRLYAPTHTP